MNPIDAFDAPEPVVVAGDELVVDLEGYEGPIDMLLVLARQQKVDLLHISILQLADQYLAFITEARRLQLEIAADYLVMAAWLAYLKSRLLLPEPEGDEEPTGSEMAEALAFQPLQRVIHRMNVGGRDLQRFVMAAPLLIAIGLEQLVKRQVVDRDPRDLDPFRRAPGEYIAP